MLFYWWYKQFKSSFYVFSGIWLLDNPIWVLALIIVSSYIVIISHCYLDNINSLFFIIL